MITEYITLLGEKFSVSRPTAEDLEKILKSINGAHQKPHFRGIEDPYGNIYNEMTPITMKEENETTTK